MALVLTLVSGHTFTEGATDTITAAKLNKQFSEGYVSAIAGTITEDEIEPNDLTGKVVQEVADDNVIGGIPVIHRIDTAGGATANFDVTLTYKTRVIDAWVVNRGAGTASDTVAITDGTNTIVAAIDISGLDQTIARAAKIDDAYHEIAAGGTLRAAVTDGGGSDVPATTVYVLGIRVA